jgi:phosphoribosylformylglycinamidine cyclo-ligase
VSDQDAYVRAGVSQPHADASVAALVEHLRRIDTGKPSRAIDLPGHYASVLRTDDRLGIAFAPDGVGTKMAVAERRGRFDTIGIDCVAMNVNDLICVGAEPIALLDFILCREANPEICGQIGRGLRSGAELAGVEIPGGEIAQVGDLVSGWELSGSAIGLVALDGIVTGERAEPGDALIGLPSSGLHSNGYTLARAALADVPLDDARLGRPLGDVLLEPTEIYVRAVLELLASDVDVRGLAHITGDGLGNLTRLVAHVGYEIDDQLPVPPIFDLIAELGEVSEDEMYEVFNMGCGFACVVAATDEAATLELLRGHYPDAKRIGSVTDRAGIVERR